MIERASAEHIGRLKARLRAVRSSLRDRRAATRPVSAKRDDWRRDRIVLTRRAEAAEAEVARLRTLLLQWTELNDMLGALLPEDLA